MKKMLSLTLALALILSLAIPAFAADTDSRDVTARYEKTETEDEIRSFDLSWGELSFTYSETTE
jgi:ABC-type proline/glycine betaine transport system substrate-binding protein